METQEDISPLALPQPPERRIHLRVRSRYVVEDPGVEPFREAELLRELDVGYKAGGLKTFGLSSAPRVGACYPGSAIGLFVAERKLGRVRGAGAQAQRRWRLLDRRYRALA